MKHRHIEWYVGALAVALLVAFGISWRLFTELDMQVATKSHEVSAPAVQAVEPVTGSITSEDIALHTITSNRIANNTINQGNLNSNLLQWIESQGSGPSAINIGINLPGLPDVSVEQLLNLLGLQGLDTTALISGVLELNGLPSDIYAKLANLNGAIIDSTSGWATKDFVIASGFLVATTRSTSRTISLRRR